ncbi:mitochondrial metalloendopeptidase OMA1 [Heracleum sosnowskyi]|uniref:Mitochondrial metalloendopeptidase OMA1 n=1 Tax=Heracleum sosnowskyi TaxID=360622 RepID=A0AAD8MM34_9APIA|nr:mitochondrial metalloendopeptidase OMA1 [Heracleum sosnowskyi]
MLTKLASYKSSILKFLYSMKPGNCSTPKNILCNINHYLIPSPLAAASGISTSLTSAAASRISSSLTSVAASGISTSLKGALRHYHNNRRLTLAPKYYSKSARFIKHVKKHKVLYMVGLGFVTIFLIGSWETIPYSKRKHFVIVPASRNKSLGNFLFKMRKVRLVLSRDHPDSVRVRSISNQLLQALQSDLKIKQMSGLEYSSKDITSNVVEKKEVTVPWWRRTRFSTGHLEGLNWEVVVVDLNIKNAYVLPGGKIVVFRGILEHCKSDAQVATVIGHEVGHVVARHYAEQFTKWLWFAIGMMIIMASAAYDPREAPKVYEMLDDDDSSDSKFKFIDDLGFKTLVKHALRNNANIFQIIGGKRRNELSGDLMFADLNEGKFLKVNGSEVEIGTLLQFLTNPNRSFKSDFLIFVTA